jgi:hypothetical protein
MPRPNGRNPRYCVWFALISAVALCGPLAAQKRTKDIPMPTEFEIGRLTYFDFGPPFDYYELLLVRPKEQGASVERVILTPHGTGCLPPKIEIAEGALSESIPTLLAGVNPCAIPKKELHQELKRCKHCPNFSGVNVTMQVACGQETRLIQADILDRDLFDPNVNTPKRTSWTMSLLKTLDQALPPGVMDKPTFDVATHDDAPENASHDRPSALDELAAGKYDMLFSGPDKPSELYQQTQHLPPPPTVELVSSTPFAPDVFVKPAYPLLGGILSPEGSVSFVAQVDDNGVAMNVTFETGPPILWRITGAAVAKWRFPKDAVGQQIHVELRFTSNCPKKTD